MTRYTAISGAAAAVHLDVMGGVREEGSTVILLGPARSFWTALKASPEWQDGAPDPIDRWSLRVIGALAEQFHGEALFPFGGPPYLPFLRWATQSGRAWQSPAGMLVHDTAGLWVSYRGALRLAEDVALPATGASPCVTCSDQPCMSACPVDALSAARGYDVAACHGYLDTPGGADCLGGGCKARGACPVSQRFGREPEQSAFHMSYFHR
ncbi:ferredoxin [Roseovarius sp. D0-M9]|uniref:ferredoxin n=1 Tax=Roseovarius sp. D0-M9 TaxID=3127117 RepID=UPI00300F9938